MNIKDKIKNKIKSKKEIEEGILNNKFEIKDSNDKPNNNSEVTSVQTSDQKAHNYNASQRYGSLYSSPNVGYVFEDFMVNEPYNDLSSDIINTKFIDNDNIVTTMENLITIINDEPKKLKYIYNVLSELINNLDVDLLPIEAKHKLAQKIIQKNSKLIDED